MDQARPTATAQLSNVGRYTVFEHGDTTLTFIAPAPLERYVEVTEWDAGYLVVQAKYSLADAPVEEYIDLVPVLEELYYDPAEFCAGIERVVIAE